MKIRKNVSLKKYTTFKIGGPAKYFLIAKTKKELIESVKWAKEKNLPFFILGSGSNLLVLDKGYKGLVIKIQNSKFKICPYGTSPAGRQSPKFKIFCEAGVALSKLVSASLKIGATGLEWAAGIPGTVGGAIRGNAGAFEGEIKDIVENVEAYDAKSRKIKILKNKDCQFCYRGSIFKHNPNLIIFSCELRLRPGNKEKIKEKMQKYLDYRQERHPKEPSAGSVFKNIGSTPAAFLIDKAGLKGEKIGGAKISPIHPNFIINSGGATAKDILLLINLTKKKIKEKFDVDLEEEVQILK